MIGGVEIPYKYGLLAYSDGDVLIHSIIDALLGATGFQDIGTLFPDSDEKYKGVDSKKLLTIVFEKIESKDFEIVNTDSTIIAEEPRLGPYIQEMRKTIASILKTSSQNVNIKAKTNEGMGFIGRKEGIASISVVLIKKL